MGKYDGSRTFAPGGNLAETLIVLASDWDDRKPVFFWHPAIDARFSSRCVMPGIWRSLAVRGASASLTVAPLA
jgi:hypothetical protein